MIDVADTEQAELPLTRTAIQVEVPIEMVRAKRTSGAAFTLACDASGLDDKEIYLVLGIDKGYFSRMKSGTATLDMNLLAPFCAIVGNVVYARWIAYQVGYALVMIKSEAERRAESAEALLADERKKVELLTGLLKGVRG